MRRVTSASTCTYERVDALQRGDHATAYDVLGQIAARYPTDRMAVRIVGLNCITQGNYRGGIDIARRSVEASPDEPQYQTMLGFFLEQSGLQRRRARHEPSFPGPGPDNLYTYHAVAHAYQARGDYHNALETFERAVSLERYPHLLWHLAEAQALLGHERMTRDYWASAAPPLPLYERIELLWRLEVLRSAPGTRRSGEIWPGRASRFSPSTRTGRPPGCTTGSAWPSRVPGTGPGPSSRSSGCAACPRASPAATGRPWGRRSWKASWPSSGATSPRPSATWRRRWRTCTPWGAAAGSRRTSFATCSWSYTAVSATWTRSIALAQQRLLANPYHIQSLAALAWAYERNGDAALHRHASRQLVRRAEEAGLAPGAPELLAARQVLQTAA